MEILIVEDDIISRNMLKKMLTEMGHSVIEAEDGAQGWDILKSRKVKFVISDWMMPELSGLDLCKKIRSELCMEYIYVIMLTAKDRKSDLVEVFGAGADDYIPKPFDPEELRARVMTGRRVIELEERHKRLADTLLESRNKLRIVFDSINEEIVSLDGNLNIVSTNHAFASRLRKNPEDVVGKFYCDNHLSEFNILCSDEFQDRVKNVFKTGKAAKDMFLGKDSDGQPTFHQISILPILNEHHQIIQVVVVSKDITEESRKTEEINSLNQQLITTSAKVEAQNAELKNTLKRLEETQAQMIHSEKMASIGQLAAGVAHEINNPTGFVSSNLKTLLDYQEDIANLIHKFHELIAEIDSNGPRDVVAEPVLQRIQQILDYEKEVDIEYIMQDITDLIADCREGTDRIKKIVIDLKDFAHPGEDKVQSININSGLDSTLNVVNNEIKYKATVRKEYSEIPEIKGYPQQLNQVFMNILVNAAQAIENKGEIVIETSQVQDNVQVIIRDSGCGIAPENLKKIFDPFFTTKDVGKGTGLGMNIAYNIVKKHRGTITVDSEMGKGTTFTISLPTAGFPVDQENNG